ncbi:hypothetical protein NE237_018423 [Protea cynaroides]|uniref:Uncharacterized protein n=1 Tax=Protea cynaroides TaxID=273540 RepID=A0A9Q0K9X6_9MAGN|nr:hypothetical protein NE237_018423 [Protea cynaroides]
MKASALLRTLSSFCFPASLSPALVTPLPIQSSFDQWLSSELDVLRCGSQQPKSYTSACWMLNALDISLSTQTMTIQFLANLFCHEEDRKVIEDYIEDIVELLDACNRIRERMETIKNYIESLRIVLHCFQGRTEPTESVLARARVILDSCESMETRYHQEQGGTELDEVLSGSMAIALLVCGILGIALSFKSKRGLPATQTRETSSWSTSLHELHKEVKEELEKQRKSGDSVLTELRKTVVVTRKLRDLMKNKMQQSSELRLNVEVLDRSCGELEEGIKPLEGRVNELYKHLISIRMVLLGILSKL